MRLPLAHGLEKKQPLFGKPQQADFGSKVLLSAAAKRLAGACPGIAALVEALHAHGRRQAVMVEQRFDGAIGIAFHGTLGDQAMLADFVALTAVLGDQPVAGGLIGKLVAKTG